MSKHAALRALAVGLAMVALATGCKTNVTATPPTAAASNATTPATPGPTTAAPTPTGAATLCDLIIEINTGAGYMTNKTYARGGPTGPQLGYIVNHVLLRQADLTTAAAAAGLVDPWHNELAFYKAMANAAAGNPSFYDDYAAGKPGALQEIAGMVPDLAGLVRDQKALANYQRTKCGITFP
jgi:hypothetical protein